MKSDVGGDNCCEWWMRRFRELLLEKFNLAKSILKALYLYKRIGVHI